MCVCVCVAFYNYALQRDTVDAETMVPSVKKQEVTNVLPLKSGVGQNIALHASPTAWN